MQLIIRPRLVVVVMALGFAACGDVNPPLVGPNTLTTTGGSDSGSTGTGTNGTSSTGGTGTAGTTTTGAVVGGTSTSSTSSGGTASTCPTYTNFASTFLANNCEGCHGSKGWNTYANAKSSASDIDSHVSDGTMPPNTTLNATDKANIIKWASAPCNAPQ